MSRALIIILFLLSSISPALSQEADQFVDDFLAVQQNEEVFLRWTISSGNTCDGTKIERSEDGISFYKIGEIPGVCGSPDKPITYDFTDMEPVKNRVNYYRLQLGFLGITSSKTVDFIMLGDEGYSIHPNPFSESAVFLFNNPDGEGYELSIFNDRGQLMINYITSENKIQLDRNSISAGTYIFRLSTAGTVVITGKFVVI